MIPKNSPEKPFEAQSMWHFYDNFKWKLKAKSVRDPIDKQHYLKYGLYCELDYNSNKMAK